MQAVNFVVATLSWESLGQPETCPSWLGRGQPLSGEQWSNPALESCGRSTLYVNQEISRLAEIGKSLMRTNRNYVQVTVPRPTFAALLFVGAAQKWDCQLRSGWLWGQGARARLKASFRQPTFCCTTWQQRVCRPCLGPCGQLGDSAFPCPYLDPESLSHYQSPSLWMKDPDEVVEPLPRPQFKASRKMRPKVLQLLDETGRLRFFPASHLTSATPTTASSPS